MALLFLDVAMKTDLFLSCDYFWHIECSILTASAFRILESSTGYPLPPLAKAHLISHSSMSDPRWLTTPSLLSRSLRLFSYSSLCILVTSWCLLLLFCPYHFCPLSCPFLHEILLDASSFLEEISSLYHSIIFFSLLFSESLHSDGYLFLFLLFLSLLFFPQLLVVSSDKHFVFLHLLLLSVRKDLVTASSTMLWTCVHSSSTTLSTRSNLFHLFVTSTLYKHNGFDFGHNWMVQWFSQLSSI